jgi:hypothetical protein
VDSNDVASYPGSGTTLTDLSPAGNDLSFGSVLSMSTVDSKTVTTFNGTGGVVIPNAPIPRDGDFTMEIVFRNVGTRALHDIVTIYPDGGATGRWQMTWGYADEMIYMYFAGLATTLYNTGSGSIPRDTWTYLVMQRSGDNITLRVNNSLKITVNLTAGYTFPVSNQVLGNDALGQTSRALDGYMPYVRLYQRALDPSELDTTWQGVGTDYSTYVEHDVWDFYSIGCIKAYQTINQFAYTGAGPYVLDYSHVELYNLFSTSAKSATVMDATFETSDDQIYWSPGSVETPKHAFRIRIPGNGTSPIPATGWSWIQRSATADNQGAWLIKRNGVTLSHTAETAALLTDPNPRTISEV